LPSIFTGIYLALIYRGSHARRRVSAGCGQWHRQHLVDGSDSSGWIGGIRVIVIGIHRLGV